ncbi:TIGR03905 family TSCPD domain-containing protein [Flavonifractor sp. DFI.6.63]|uniref:TIGR03905 family TSCPD domain-containing protein n=1 Tax=Flavonifractor sp. DFI.6.63 TaxID=2963704 RepID=UPI00210A8A50|nr:TIGR03905 family TSCPD domain-containing protein [Flavonifractor sp. DFI.6.63]MCQ5030253.1 TIGR03905 family TSCPD domain-containing protein [Flavonifractor sp. DFI.6.63]
MTIEYRPRGVCSQKMTLEVERGVIRSLRVEGGCNGNLQGLARLVEGMEVEEVIRRLDGIKCGFKSTSCPDQLAQALKKAREA